MHYVESFSTEWPAVLARRSAITLWHFCLKEDHCDTDEDRFPWSRTHWVWCSWQSATIWSWSDHMEPNCQQGYNIFFFFFSVISAVMDFCKLLLLLWWVRSCIVKFVLVNKSVCSNFAALYWPGIYVNLKCLFFLQHAFAYDIYRLELTGVILRYSNLYHNGNTRNKLIIIFLFETPFQHDCTQPPVGGWKLEILKTYFRRDCAHLTFININLYFAELSAKSCFVAGAVVVSC